MPRPTTSFVFDPTTGGDDPSPIPRTVPKTKRSVRVGWTVDFETSGIVGYNVSLYDEGVDPTDAEPRFFATVREPAATSHVFKDVPAGIYTAFVQTVAEGVDGEWVSSTQEVFADDQVPTIRTSDDRTVAGFAADFRGTSMPVGMTVVNGTWSRTEGKLTITPNSTSGGSACYLEWDLDAWITANLDASARKSGVQVMTAIIKFQVADTAAWYALPAYPGDPSGFPPSLTYNDADGNVRASSFLPTNDGLDHQYHVSLGRCLTTAVDPNDVVTIQFYPYVKTGFPIVIDAIAMMYKNTDLSLAGDVDLGLNARDQFGVADGGDFFGVAPVRLVDSLGNVNLVNENGQFYLRNESGQLITERGYKLGRRVRVPIAYSTAPITFASLGIPDPVAIDKVRLIVEATQQTLAEIAVTTYPHRMAAFAYDIQRTKFSPFLVGMQGGVPQEYSASGPWSPAAKAKSSLTLRGIAEGVTTDSTNDAWYYGAGEAPVGTTSYAYFLHQLQLNVAMPTVKKPDGSYYWIDLDFYIWTGEGDTTLGYLRFTNSGNYRQWGPYRIRAYTDGQTRPYIFLVSEIYANYLHNYRFDFVSYTREDAAVTAIYPSSMSFTKVTMQGITWNGSGRWDWATSGTAFNLIYLEEH